MNLPIQYLRGISSILVVFAHFHSFPILKYFCGAIGVDIFFIISGIIMAKTVSKYQNNKFEFIINRVKRIYPLYIAVSLPFFIHAYFIRGFTINKIIESIFFIGGDFYHYNDPILFAGWSLFYEFIFYFLLIILNNKTWTNIILAFLGIIGLIFKIDNIFGMILNSFYLLFLIGFNFQYLTDKMSILKSKGHFLISCIILLFVMLSKDSGSFGYVPRQLIDISWLNFQSITTSFPNHIPRIFFWGIPCFYFIINFIDFFINLNEIKFLRRLGDISYSIYLVHAALYLINSIISPHLENKLDKVLLYCAIFALILPFSYITYKYIEIPLLKKSRSGRLKNPSNNQ